MKNAKIRRILLLLACAVLLVSLSVGATLAYLTSTDEVENTFTVGDVQIELDETNYDGVDQDNNDNKNEARDKSNKYNLVPGVPCIKDPIVTVLKNSEPCYVRVKVIVDVSGCEGDEDDTVSDFKTWAGTFAANYILTDKIAGFNGTYWNASEPVINTDAYTVTYILTYKSGDTNNIVGKSDKNTELKPVFTHIQAPFELNNADIAKLAGMKINVVAEAIQAEGFTASDGKTAEEIAWEAFEDN